MVGEQKPIRFSFMGFIWKFNPATLMKKLRGKPVLLLLLS